MRLVTYATTESKDSRLGALLRATDAIVDLHALGQRHGEDVPLGGLIELLEAGPRGLERVARLIEVFEADAGDWSDIVVALDRVRLMAPIPRPGKILCTGVNYRDHLTEVPGRGAPRVPSIFAKLPSNVVGPHDDIVHPGAPHNVDYEVELAVVIGTRAYRVSRDRAFEVVAGYTIMNDVSARDVQLATTQWSLGKSFPTFAPMGPWVVSKDDVPDPHALSITLTIGSEKLQDSNTSLLIFKIPTLIEYISGITPLQAGDIISTGTPAGVGMGRNPQRWVKPGEEMVIRIDRIGELRNKLTAEK